MSYNITAILMPFRKNNIQNVLNGLKIQSIKPEIWIWDDCGDFENIGEYTYFRCNRSMSHIPRYLIAGLVSTEYTFIQDDDFEITDTDLMVKLIQLSKQYPDHIIGTKGKIFDEKTNREKPYQDHWGWCGEGVVDFVNTGLCFFPTRLINNLKVNPFHGEDRLTHQEYRYGDDMYISSRNKCYASELFVHGVKKLDECGLGVSHDPIHMDIRNKLCRRYWL